MSKPTNETGLVAAIKRAILKEWPSAFVLKVHGGPFQEPGIPDLLVVIRGHAIFLEAKFQRPGESTEHALGRVTPLQWSQIDRLRMAGATADATLSVEDSLAIIRTALGES